jgi:hypothetical protein
MRRAEAESWAGAPDQDLGRAGLVGAEPGRTRSFTGSGSSSLRQTKWAACGWVGPTGVEEAWVEGRLCHSSREADDRVPVKRLHAVELKIGEVSRRCRSSGG